MISDERVIHWRNLYAGNRLADCPLEDADWILIARAIEREAIAEPVRLMREWAEAYKGKSVSRFVAAEQAIRDYLERMK